MPSLSPRNFKSLACLLACFAVLFVLNTTFTNCGGVGSVVSQSSQPQMSYDEKVTALQSVHAGQVTKDFCRDSSRYACLYKVFSTAVSENTSEPAVSVCTQLSDQTEICVSTQKFTFASFSAKQNCGPSCDQSQLAQFDSEQYECHLKLSLNADGIYPLVAVEDRLNAALEKVYRSCVKIENGTKP